MAQLVKNLPTMWGTWVQSLRHTLFLQTVYFLSVSIPYTVLLNDKHGISGNGN